MRSLDPTAAQAERDRTARLMSAERRLNEALQHLEELLRMRRELDRLPAIDPIQRP
jgi:GTP1/Obg family GTP-binding protein